MNEPMCTLKSEKLGTFYGYEDVEHIRDSMQFNSDTVICKYKTADGKFKAIVEVLGEVAVDYYPNGREDGEIADRYYNYSEFPKELQELFNNGDAYMNDNVDILNNNWFEITYFENGEMLDSDVLEDCEGNSFLELFKICAECVALYRKEIGK